MRGIRKITFLITILTLLITGVLKASLQPLYLNGNNVYLDNNNYQSQLINKVFCTLSAVTAVKVPNDPADNDLDEMKNVPTFFVNKIEGDDGYGTIVFGNQSYYQRINDNSGMPMMNYGGYTNVPSFYDIAEVGKVYDIFQKSRQNEI